MHRAAPRTPVASLLGLCNSSSTQQCTLARCTASSSSSLHTSCVQRDFRKDTRSDAAARGGKGRAPHMHAQTERLFDAHKMARSPPSRTPRAGSDRNANWSVTPGSKFSDGSRNGVAVAESVRYGTRQVRQAPMLRDEKAAKRMREEAKLVAMKAKELETLITALPVNVGRPLQPGDCIELRTSFAQLGIVLSTPPSSRAAIGEDAADYQPSGVGGAGQEIIVLSPSGTVELWRQTDVMLMLPQLASLALAKKSTPESDLYILQPPSVQGQHETERPEEPVNIERFEARNTLCARMRAMSRMAEREMQRLLPAFRSICLEDADEPGALAHMDTNTFSTAYVAKLLDEHTIRASGKPPKGPQRLTQPKLLATHQLLMMHPSRFLADPLSHIKTQLFTLRTPAERCAIERIDALLKAPDGSAEAAIVRGFSERARKVLAWRKAGCSGVLQQLEAAHRASPALSRATEAQGPGVQWTRDDEEILRFLRATLGVRRLIQGNAHGAAAMALLKLCGAHVNVEPATAALEEPIKVPDELLPYGNDTACAGQDLQHALVSRFLEHLGALAPWQNLSLAEAGFEQTTGGAEGIVGSGAPTTAEEKAFAAPALLPGEMDKRRDFGALPVYVIDDATAYELDDGISFERASEDQTWIHVHVADPTAVISPNDAYGKAAKRQHTSLYLPEARWPLLPDALINAGQLGLGSKFEDARAAEERLKHGLRALTFSARVEDKTGKVLDYAVAPSLIRDVRIMTYAAVNELLLAPPSTDRTSMAWQMQTLERCAVALLRWRVDRGAFQAQGPSPAISISPLPLPLPPVYAAPHTHDVYSGFPRIALEVQRDVALAEFQRSRRSQAMVAECMVLAGRVAGATAVDRNIPLVWRAQEEGSKADTAKLLAMRDENGEVRYKDLMRGNIALSGGASSPKAASHFAMGLRAVPTAGDATAHGGYARATSPLRRYPDLVAHWQLKASLRGDALPWDMAALKRDLPRFVRMDAWARAIEKSTVAFWAATRLAQVLAKQRAGALDAEESRLLGPHEAVITLRDVRQSMVRMDVRARVIIPALGVSAECEWSLARGTPDSGQCFMVNVVDVTRTGMRTAVLVRPTDM